MPALLVTVNELAVVVAVETIVLDWKVPVPVALVKVTLAKVDNPETTRVAAVVVPVEVKVEAWRDPVPVALVKVTF